MSDSSWVNCVIETVLYTTINLIKLATYYNTVLCTYAAECQKLYILLYNNTPELYIYLQDKKEHRFKI